MADTHLAMNLQCAGIYSFCNVHYMNNDNSSHPYSTISQQAMGIEPKQSEYTLTWPLQDKSQVKFTSMLGSMFQSDITRHKLPRVDAFFHKSVSDQPDC